MSELDTILSLSDPQGTDEWRAERGGRFTASRFGALMSNGRGSDKPGKTFDTYVREVATERIIGQPAEGFEGNAWTDHGNDYEDEARQAFEKATGIQVIKAPFVALDSWVGGSVDGFCGDGATLEIKCPAKPKFHMDALIDRCITPGRGYEWQVQGGFHVTGRTKGYWASYCPFFPEDQRLVWFEIKPDRGMIDRLKVRLALAQAAAEKIIEQLMP